MDGYGYKFNELPAKEKLTSSNYVTWALAMKPPLFSCGCSSLIFGSYGRPPMQRPVNNFLPNSQAFFQCRYDQDRWDRSDEAGYNTILLNVTPSQRFIVEQNPSSTTLHLWNQIRQLHRNNTNGHRGLARQKWQTCRQTQKLSLDDYISAYGKAHNELLQ